MIILILFRVSGHSMLPTFKPGQTLLISGISYVFRKPKVGDVVVVKDPRDGRLLLKRITSIHTRHSGDSERSVEDSRTPLVIRRFWTSQNDGEVKYFVSGDNPKDSTDSRAFGSIQKTDIVGKVIWG